MTRIKIKIFGILVILFLSASYSWGEATETDESAIGKTVAEEIALNYIKMVGLQGKVVFNDISYDYKNNSPQLYIVVLAVNQEFWNYSKKDILAYYEKSSSDKSLRSKLNKGIKTVFVSATKDKPPIPLAKEGLPIYLTNREQLIEKASQYLGKSEKDLIWGVLRQIYKKGICVEIKSNDGATVLIRAFNSEIIEDDLSSLESESEDDSYNKKERIEYYQKAWELYDYNKVLGNNVKSTKSLSLSSCTPLPLTYISNYSHLSLRWNQNQITNTLPCAGDGEVGCCYVASTTSLLSFWDDNLYNNAGPYEDLVTNGDGIDQDAVSNLASELYTAIVGSDNQCRGSIFGIDKCGQQIRDGITATVNEERNYNFDVVLDSFPNQDSVITEISNDRPFLWIMHGYEDPELGMDGTGHVVVGVGYYTDAECKLRINAYTNWEDPVLYDFYYDNPWDYNANGIVTVIPGMSTSTPPTVTVNYPNGGENWSGTQNILWTATDTEQTGVNALSATLYYGVSASGPWTEIAGGRSCTNGVQASYSWNTSAIVDGTYYVRIVVSDGEGGSGEDISNSSFTISNATATFTVCSSGCDYSSIQDAIDAASDGYMVLVHNGTYYENIDFKGKAITLRSNNGPDVTIIDGDIDGDDVGDGSVVTFNSNEDKFSVLDGFTITNGIGTASYWENYGGGIYCNSSSPSIINCIITSNTVNEDGGGIYCRNHASPTIANCTISNNTAEDDGGGIFCYESSSPSIINCIITGNSGDDGAGIHCGWESSPTITNCTIDNNLANYDGGGIYCWESSSPSITNSTITGNSAEDGGGISCHESSSPTITNCTVNNNSATDTGGGIHCHSSSSPIITNCTISNNYAGEEGGGIRCVRSTLSLESCVISGNSSAKDGGGIHCFNASPSITNCTISGNSTSRWGGGIFFIDSETSIMNCTISGNSADEAGGGIFCGYWSSPTVVNSILWGDKAAGSLDEIYFDEDGAIDISYSNVEGGDPDNPGQPYPGPGNIEDNPIFVNQRPASYAPTSSGDYHLQTGSPCIDTGTNENAPANDIDGSGRPQDGDENGSAQYDMGSDEFMVGCTDADNDGYYAQVGCRRELDCDDSDDNIHPGATEVCDDGIDNNCDGATDGSDKDCDIVCQPNDTISCDTGLQGACLAGTQTCNETGTWGECVQNNQPNNEICDGIDNNCNGHIDEGCDPPVFNVIIDLIMDPIEICFTPDQPLNANPIVTLEIGNGIMNPISGAAVSPVDNSCSDIADAFTYCVDYTPNGGDSEVEIRLDEDTDNPVVSENPGFEIAGFMVNVDHERAASFCLYNGEGGNGSLQDNQCNNVASVESDAGDLDLSGSGLGPNDCILVRIVDVDPAGPPAMPNTMVSGLCDINLPNGVKITSGQTLTVTLRFELTDGSTRQDFDNGSKVFEVYYYDEGTSSWKSDGITITVTQWETNTSGTITFTATHLTAFAVSMKSTGGGGNDDDTNGNDGDDGTQAASGGGGGGGCSVTNVVHNISTSEAAINSLIFFLPLIIIGIKRKGKARGCNNKQVRK